MSRRIVVLVLALLLGSCSSGDYSALFTKADWQQSQGRYDEALKTYQAIIEKAPTSVQAKRAYLYSANVYFYGLRNFQNALAIYQDLADTGEYDEITLEAHRRLAELLHEYLHQYTQAIQQYQRLLPHADTLDEAAAIQVAIADCYFALNNFKQARLEYEAVLKNFPRSKERARAQFQIGETFYLENDCKSARQAYDAVVEQYTEGPFVIRARFGQGNCSEELGNYAEALRIYQSVKESYPNPAVVAMKMQNLERRLKHLPKAYSKTAETAEPTENEEMTKNLGGD